MFELFKIRSFSDYISDTITFFKKFGKNYFKNYITVNGIFILILLVLIYFLSKIYVAFLQSLAPSLYGSSSSNDGSYLVEYFSNNIPLFIIIIILFIILSGFLSMISISYPIYYLKIIEEKKGNYNQEITVQEVITKIKSNIGRLFIFFLGIMFIIIPLLIIIFAINLLLCFIIIGIFLFFITIPAAACWINFSFFDYINNETGFFESLKNGYYYVKQKFWNTIGTTLVMTILVEIVKGFITMVPYFVGLVVLFTTGSYTDPNAGPYGGGFPILISAIMIISVLLSYLFNNFILINQGLIYYSLREENEEHGINSQIDLIGTESE